MAASNAVINLAEDDDDNDADAAASSSTSKRKRSTSVAKKATPTKKKKEKKPPKEKRAARYRSSCPQGLQERMGRAMSQRMYMVRKEEVQVDGGDNDKVGSLSSYWKFVMLGSTGNVYDVCLTHKPTCTCPDFQKRGDLCKHLIFVLLRVVGLDRNDPLAYQKAYLTSELEDMYERMKQRSERATGGAAVWANQRVQSQYAALKDGKKKGDCEQEKEEEEEEEGAVKRRPLEEQDCPICLEELTNCPISEVTFCKDSCGVNFHKECMNQWRRAASNKRLTCPNCRAEQAPPPKKKKGGGGKSNQNEGYVNMGGLQGQSRVRDTSTYNYRSYRYRRGRYWEGSDDEDEYDY